jgi:Arc-like DNA binding domain
LALALAHGANVLDNGSMNTEQEQEQEQELVRISIRFPREVAVAMRRLAREHDRSINGEMIRTAREYIARQQKKR